jgi:uncharacterized RDD family membrane protein YckC
MADLNFKASPSQRFYAFAIDAFLINGVQFFGGYLGALVAAVVMATRGAPEEIIQEATSSGMLLGWFFWGMTGWILNFGVLQGSTGSTIGKIVFRIRVVDTNSGAVLGFWKSLVRSAGYTFSVLPVGMGFFWMFTNNKRQTWHDALVGSKVERQNIKVEKVAEVIQLPYYGPALPVTSDQDKKVA